MAVQAARMARLVSDLLSLGRIELNEHIPPAGRVDLDLAVTDVLDAVALLARQRNVRIEIESHAASARVVGDREEIVQVLQNLIDNALKYSPQGGRVAVRLAADQGPEGVAAPRFPGAVRLPLLTPDRQDDARYVAVTVRDHGPGIAEEHLPRLTERFYRVNVQESRSRGGTGLGLAIVKHIVNRHRGQLVIESEEGVGSVFRVWLPAEEG